MNTNPFIKIMEPVLGLGFILHIVYAFILTVKNRAARPVGYDTQSLSNSSKWASRNMFVLGFAILLFLGLHIFNFYVKMKITHTGIGMTLVDGVEMHDAYTFVSSLFINYPAYDAIYIVAFILLGFHLSHGFWSMFQTIGWSNEIWKKRLTVIGNIYAVVIVVGYSIIPLYFLLK